MSLELGLAAIWLAGAGEAVAAHCHVRSLAEVPRCHRGNAYAEAVWAREMVGRPEPTQAGHDAAVAAERLVFGDVEDGGPTRGGAPHLLRLPGAFPGSGATHLLIGRGTRLALLRLGPAETASAGPLATGTAGNVTNCEIPPGTVEERAQFDGEPGQMLPRVGVLSLPGGTMLRLTWRVTEGYAGGGASSEAAQLVRLSEGELRPAGCFLVASYANLAGEWNRDRSRQRHVHVSGWRLSGGRQRPVLRSTTDRLPPVPLTWDAAAGAWRLAPPARPNGR